MADFKLYLDGELTEASAGETFTTADPSTGETVGTVASAGRADAHRAIRAARDAYRGGSWSALPAAERERIMVAVARGIRARSDEIAALEVRDSGATRAKARSSDVSGGAFWFKTMAAFGTELGEPEMLPQTTSPGPSANYLRHEPVGVCVAILPWNFPFLMACWKVSMALAAGNSIILKPAPETPASATVLADVLTEAGVPPGVVNVLPGPGPGLGEELVSHDDVDRVSFTGSIDVGKRVAASAAQTLKNVTLELGGKCAQIVLEDADPELAVDGALYAMFFHSGQVCTAGSRLLVADSIYAEFVARLVERSRGIVVGLADDERTTMGPLISQRQLDRVQAYVAAGVGEGAKLLTGGERLTAGGLAAGYFIAPTIFGEVTPEMTIAREEIFGPVLSVIRYGTVAEAIDIANGTIYGLAAGVWGPAAQAMDVAQRLRAGTVWINDYNLLSPKYPFGGMGQSGVGREHGKLGLAEWTETKHVHVALDATRASKRWFDVTIPQRGGA